MKIKLFPKLNKANKQISFDLKKRKVPKEFKSKLSKLKWIELEGEDFKFGD